MTPENATIGGAVGSFGNFVPSRWLARWKVPFSIFDIFKKTIGRAAGECFEICTLWMTANCHLIC